MNEKLITSMKKYNVLAFSNSNPIELEIPYKTKDGRKVFRKTIDTLASLFNLPQTKSILGLLLLENKENNKEIISNISKNHIPINLAEPKSSWRLPYEVIIVTEDETTYSKLKNKNIPCQILYSEFDVHGLERYDLVRVIKCEKYSNALEDLNQSEFFNSIENIYPESNLLLLSKWKNNLYENQCEIFEELHSKISSILQIDLVLASEKLKKEDVETKIYNINKKISSNMETMSFTGHDLIKVANDALPENLKNMIFEELNKEKIKRSLILEKIPLEIDYEELDKEIKLGEINSSKKYYKNIYDNIETIKQIPEIIYEFKIKILLIDFFNGINKYKEFNSHQIEEGDLDIVNSSNLFLKNAQPISYNLKKYKGVILTGANSGGKTTLLEHIIQLSIFSRLGLPNSGKIIIPNYEHIYYFAKSSGSLNKGAFETLLTQLSKIDYSKKTLILADELEAVTEPGVAAKIIATTMDYYLSKGCELIFASHLGKEILEHVGDKVRVDGIEAKGLDSENNVIIDHNPVIGKLARSTPELIVEKMALQSNEEFFSVLSKKLKI